MGSHVQSLHSVVRKVFTQMGSHVQSLHSVVRKVFTHMGSHVHSLHSVVRKVFTQMGSHVQSLHSVVRKVFTHMGSHVQSLHSVVRFSPATQFSTILVLTLTPCIQWVHRLIPHFQSLYSVQTLSFRSQSSQSVFIVSPYTHYSVVPTFSIHIQSTYSVPTFSPYAQFPLLILSCHILSVTVEQWSVLCALTCTSGHCCCRDVVTPSVRLVQKCWSQIQTSCGVLSVGSSTSSDRASRVYPAMSHSRLVWNSFKMKLSVHFYINKIVTARVPKSMTHPVVVFVSIYL